MITRDACSIVIAFVTVIADDDTRDDARVMRGNMHAIEVAKWLCVDTRHVLATNTYLRKRFIILLSVSTSDR